MVKLDLYGRGRPLRMAIMFTCQLAFIFFGIFSYSSVWRIVLYLLLLLILSANMHLRLRPRRLLRNRRQRRLPQHRQAPQRRHPGHHRVDLQPGLLLRDHSLLPHGRSTGPTEINVVCHGVDYRMHTLFLPT